MDFMFLIATAAGAIATLAAAAIAGKSQSVGTVFDLLFLAFVIMK